LMIDGSGGITCRKQIVGFGHSGNTLLRCR
jgi:hypothetical protein